MSQYEKLLIFLASPSDVPIERRYIENIIEELNRTVADNKGIILQLVKWETNAYPGYGKDAQALINEQIAEMSKYALFVGIMWNRLGTPTPRSISGTVEEFNLAAEALKNGGQPEIWFYFRNSPSNLTTEEQLDQRKRVLAFRKEVEGNGMPFVYRGPTKFKEMFRNQIILWLNNRTRKIDNKGDKDLSDKVIESAMGILLAVQYAERNSITQQNYDAAYNKWEIEKQLLSNKFQDNGYGKELILEWSELSETITLIYALSGTFDKKYRRQVINKIAAYLKNTSLDTATLLNHELKTTSTNNFHKYFNTWWTLREAIVLRINEFVKKV